MPRLGGLRFWIVIAWTVACSLAVPGPGTAADQAVAPGEIPRSAGSAADHSEVGVDNGQSDVARGSAAASNQQTEGPSWADRVDSAFGNYVVDPLVKVLFYDFGTSEWLGVSVPLVVIWLFAGAVFFTLRMGFINIRGFWHAIRVTRGDYDDPDDQGEVSHFQALASALSATVGLGNIAGVAIAVSIGGPGAIFWLIVAGILGMSTKFAECTLGQIYRKVDPDGTVSGGPMHYLREGLTEMGLRPLGIVLAMIFAVVCMGGSFGGGCVFQVSQSLEALRAQVPFLDRYPLVYGLGLMTLVGIVIIGGIRRIAATAEKIVPLMCGIYVASAIYILVVNYHHIVPAFALIVTSAFTGTAVHGGFLGFLFVMVTGIQRAAFSNEAGLGSASIAHAAARTDEPISEGIVALLEPFIDTVVICTMTGLVIVITGVYENPAFADYVNNEKGAPLTAEAFKTAIWWFPYVLSVAVCLFAYSTLISWSYYGERCWSLLFGRKSSMIYKFIFLGFVVLGSIVTATKLRVFSDLMILSMAFPNILGVVLLSGKVRRALDDYWARLKSGEIKTAVELAQAGGRAVKEGSEA